MLAIIDKIFQHRQWVYIYHSRTDFIDGWLNALLLILGIYLIWVQPVEKIQYYHFLLRQEIGSISLGISTGLAGLINLIRLCLPWKMNIFVVIALKCISMLFFLLMFISIVNNEVIPIASVFYGMTSLLAIDNIKRTV